VSESVVVALRVTPRSSRDAIEGVDEAGEIRVRVTAAPADGAANKAVIKLLAKSLGVPKRALTLVSGVASRHKRLQIEGVSAVAVQQHWPGVSVGNR